MTLRPALRLPNRYRQQRADLLVAGKPLRNVAEWWSTVETRDLVLSDRWVLASLVAALFVRFFRLDSAPFWYDETITANWILLPWGEMIRTALADNHPPLYFVVLKAWSELAGHSPWALRMPSALLSFASVPLCAALAARLAGVRAGRWAAWFAALSPYLIHHGQEVRMYSAVAALAAAQLLLLVRFLTGASSSLRLWFVVATVALVGSHYYGVALVAGEMVVLFVLWPRPLRVWLPGATGACIAGGGALLSAALLARHSAGGAYEIGPLALPGVLWAMISGYTLLPDSSTLHGYGLRAALPYIPVACAGAVALWVAAITGLRSLGHVGRVVVLGTLGTTLVWPLAIGLVLDVGINPRYCISGFPALAALVAAGVPASRTARAAAAATIALGLVTITGSALHLADPAHGREDVAGAGRWLDTHIPAGEEILVTSGQMMLLARFHWPQRRLRLFPSTGPVTSRDSARELAAEIPFPGPDRAIYVVGRAWQSDPDSELERALLERYEDCGGITVRGIHILCLQRPLRQD